MQSPTDPGAIYNRWPKGKIGIGRSRLESTSLPWVVHSPDNKPGAVEFKTFSEAIEFAFGQN